MKLFLSICEFLYIRWRVFRVVSTSTIDPDADSLLSSSFEAERKVYRQFMNYGTTDETIPGHIFLSNSASYVSKPIVVRELYYSDFEYAIEPDNLCQLSKPSSLFGSDEYNGQEQSEVLEESDLYSDTCSLIDEETNSCRLYERWMSRGVRSKPRRLLPRTPTDPSVQQALSFVQTDSQGSLFDNLFNLASRGSEGMTYPEEQRQIRNYFFTRPLYFENDENRHAEERRLDELERLEGARRREKEEILEQQRLLAELEALEAQYDPPPPPIYAERLNSNSYENVYLRQEAEEREREQLLLLDETSGKYVESYSFNSVLASTAVPMGSESSEYQTASISSPIAREISERFSQTYWRVEDYNSDGAIGARDNYHNRYFGKAGYFLTRNAIENQANGNDTMPAVERRALKKERRRWTEINERGGRYDNVEIPIPDTNGRRTNHWEEEYEEPLPPHTSDTWRMPKCEQKCLRSEHSLVGGVVVKGVAVAADVVVGAALVVVE
ncbi:hypothetical protein GCK72_022204 [Caenorhabditis remanei]|uniref:Uncharacterized protein n=1 Tax=Caenorhabditis remanei TaxID=31234 RepID=A0A6A5FT51_CAERE|nr:hypothetical protein GCK72_022204 [Caenorhabditis remanei]KAF1745757.1 hypothetical protein GCK72_022204 [Caenorhabditis remanei]